MPTKNLFSFNCYKNAGGRPCSSPLTLYSILNNHFLFYDKLGAAEAEMVKVVSSLFWGQGFEYHSFFQFTRTLSITKSSGVS